MCLSEEATTTDKDKTKASSGGTIDFLSRNKYTILIIIIGTLVAAVSGYVA